MTILLKLIDSFTQTQKSSKYQTQLRIFKYLVPVKAFNNKKIKNFQLGLSYKNTLKIKLV